MSPAIKRTVADREFSNMVRERDGWQCQRCGKQYSPPTMALHAAHCFSRGKASTRHDPSNAVALCYGCHSYVDANPEEKYALFRDWLGTVEFENLRRRSENKTRTAPRELEHLPKSKKCRRCGEVKLRQDFGVVRRLGRGTVRLSTNCKPCSRVLGREAYKRNPRRFKSAVIKRLYGLTQEAYDCLLTEQNGACAICGATPTGSGTKVGSLHVDHDHHTGRVRGLLCHHCNAGIAFFHEDPRLMTLAMKYLEDTGGAEVEEEGTG